MRSHFAVSFLAVLVSTCVADEASCTAGAGSEDDHCTLLQGHVGVASKDAVQSKSATDEHLHEDLAEHHAQGDSVATALKELDDHHATAHSEGWPGDLFKQAADLLGGAGKLEKDFEDVKTQVGAFASSVHSDMEELVNGVSQHSTLSSIRGKVEQTYEKIHVAATKLWEALDEVAKAWLNGLGKFAPQQLKYTMKTVLDKVTGEAKQFADAFKTAADDLKIANSTEVCHKVKHGLHTVLKKASALAGSATGFSTKGISKELIAAKDALPDTLKKEVEKILHKANEAADRILRNLTPSMKEITHGVAKAYGDHCKGIPHSGAGRLEVSLVLSSVLSALFFSM